MRRTLPFIAVITASLLFGCLASLAPIGDAPDFTLLNVAGGTLNSADLRGKVVVVDFWATWCDPCIKEIPKYNKLRENLAQKGLEIVGITQDSGKLDKVRMAVTKLKIQYPVVMGNDDVGDDFGGLVGYPTTFVVGKDWKIYRRYSGSPESKIEKIEQDVRRLLEK
jgi:thiol-disulfide isomerase/thioredoxin